jgi:hypothetical protein
MPNAVVYWFKATELNDQNEVALAVSVPAFLVYNGFDIDMWKCLLATSYAA